MMKTHKHVVLLGCVLLACLLCGVVFAQSGRRQPPAQSAPPVPTPTPVAPTPTPAPPPEIKLLVTSYAPASMNLSMIDTNIVGETFVQRLQASKSLKLQTADHMSRDAARKRAKNAEDGRFVVWIELQVNGMSTDPSGVQRPRAEDLHIQYIVFEPTTGNIRVDGNVYLRPIGSINTGRRDTSCLPGWRYGIDGALMLGAIETANRIYNAFSIPTPPLCP